MNPTHNLLIADDIDAHLATPPSRAEVAQFFNQAIAGSDVAKQGNATAIMINALIDALVKKSILTDKEVADAFEARSKTLPAEGGK